MPKVRAARITRPGGLFAIDEPETYQPGAGRMLALPVRSKDLPVFAAWLLISARP